MSFDEGWTHNPALRETFLCYLTRPEDRAAAVRWGQLLEELQLEKMMEWPPLPSDLVTVEVNAAVDELLQLAAYLKVIGQRRVQADRVGPDPRISQIDRYANLIRHLARRLGRLVEPPWVFREEK